MEGRWAHRIQRRLVGASELIELRTLPVRHPQYIGRGCHRSCAVCGLVHAVLQVEKQHRLVSSRPGDRVSARPVIVFT